MSQRKRRSGDGVTIRPKCAKYYASVFAPTEPATIYAARSDCRSKPLQTAVFRPESRAQSGTGAKQGLLSIGGPPHERVVRKAPAVAAGASVIL